MPSQKITDQSSSEHTNKIVVMQNRKYHLAGDKVNQATKELPDNQRRELRWLHLHAVENDLSLEDIAKLIKKDNGASYSRDSIYQALTGRREASLDNLCKAIEKTRKIIEERSTIRRADFVETNLTGKIFKLCEAALTYQKILFLFGPSQIGKTTALEEYARRNNHGQTIYVRMPTGGCQGEFLGWLALALRISPDLKIATLKQRIISAFDDRMLLIVDEVHECFSSNYSDRGIKSLNFCREIHDRTKCGVVLSGTEVFEEEMQRGRHKKILKQLQLRGLAATKLPQKPTTKQLQAFAAQYELKPAEGDALELQQRIIADDGLGRWCTILQAGSRVAARRKGKMTWQHVQDAYAAILNLEKGI